MFYYRFSKASCWHYREKARSVTKTKNTVRKLQRHIGLEDDIVVIEQE
jgi:hypothetical protein